MTVQPSPQVMGILNVTPDSFSDGGQYVKLEAAIEGAQAMVRAGADLIDVGGESTRPGSARVAPEEEQRRVLPVVRALAQQGTRVSIDTINADTARLAVEAGAEMVNDVSGGTADPEMRRVIADTGAKYVVMHWRGIPDPQHSRANYANVVEEVREELAVLAAAAMSDGVRPEQIILDPGFGFDKTTEQGWQLLAGLARLQSLGYPVLIGASRKRMLKDTLGSDSSMRDRDIATAAVSALAAAQGVWGVRVHDVEATVSALAVARAWHGAAASNPHDFADSISVRGLEVFAHHGVFEFEREAGQRFIIDAEVSVDLRPAAVRDDLHQTVNYAELVGALRESAERDPVDLIETLAERLAGVALNFAGVGAARITVHKPDAPIEATFSDISVTITRTGRSQ